MSYITCEDALAAIIQALTGYSATNVGQGDYKVLGKGKVKAVVLQPGAYSSNMAGQQWKRNAWNINIELYVMWQETQDIASTDVKEVRQALINHLDQYPTLNSNAGTVRAMVVEGREPEIWQMGARQYWRQILVMQVEERLVVSYAANG